MSGDIFGQGQHRAGLAGDDAGPGDSYILAGVSPVMHDFWRIEDPTSAETKS